MSDEHWITVEVHSCTDYDARFPGRNELETVA